MLIHLINGREVVSGKEGVNYRGSEKRNVDVTAGELEAWEGLRCRYFTVFGEPVDVSYEELVEQLAPLRSLQARSDPPTVEDFMSLSESLLKNILLGRVQDPTDYISRETLDKVSEAWRKRATDGLLSVSNFQCAFDPKTPNYTFGALRKHYETDTPEKFLDDFKNTLKEIEFDRERYCKLWDAIWEPWKATPESLGYEPDPLEGAHEQFSANRRNLPPEQRAELCREMFGALAERFDPPLTANEVRFIASDRYDRTHGATDITAGTYLRAATIIEAARMQNAVHRKMEEKGHVLKKAQGEGK
jgi:hypothetical protein